MKLFNFFKKTPSQARAQTAINPYRDRSVNFTYNLLFCDNPDLYKEEKQQPHIYPFDLLFSETVSVKDLQKIIEDEGSDPRVKILAYNKQIALGHSPTKKELLGVIIEVALDEGLDVLASFNNGTARYINHTERIIVWETTHDEAANKITNDLFTCSQHIVNQIGPWDKPRRPNPAKGNVRISFLVADGLYFGEGPINVLFNDPMASPALAKATELMQYLTRKSLEKNN
ncbi:hypothetical protein [Runella sp.]|uniref:hypothetical protein n=1 Tax=Runella sp. TaxID=1960881 RepID=UPI003D0CB586